MFVYMPFIIAAVILLAIFLLNPERLLLYLGLSSLKKVDVLQ